jgi:hypothetical protein
MSRDVLDHIQLFLSLKGRSFFARTTKGVKLNLREVQITVFDAQNAKWTQNLITVKNLTIVHVSPTYDRYTPISLAHLKQCVQITLACHTSAFGSQCDAFNIDVLPQSLENMVVERCVGVLPPQRLAQYPQVKHLEIAEHVRISDLPCLHEKFPNLQRLRLRDVEWGIFMLTEELARYVFARIVNVIDKWRQKQIQLEYYLDGKWHGFNWCEESKNCNKPWREFQAQINFIKKCTETAPSIRSNFSLFRSSLEAL